MEWILSDIQLFIGKYQFGSLKCSPVLHCLVRLLEDSHSVLDKPQNCAVLIATDSSKAFSRVDHNIVINKLIQLGVRASLIPWLSSFYQTDYWYRQLSTIMFCQCMGVFACWSSTRTKLEPISVLVMIN